VPPSGYGAGFSDTQKLFIIVHIFLLRFYMAFLMFYNCTYCCTFYFILYSYRNPISASYSRPRIFLFANVLMFYIVVTVDFYVYYANEIIKSKSNQKTTN